MSVDLTTPRDLYQEGLVRAIKSLIVVIVFLVVALFAIGIESMNTPVCPTAVSTP